MQLKSYQIKAVEELYENISGLLDKPQLGFSNNVLLKAPTGAGKTVIITGLLDMLCQNYASLAFLWVSIGSGGLHLQSAKTVSAMSKNLRVCTGEDILGGSVRSLGHRDVLFLSWDQMKNRNANGEWENLLMRDGEAGNLRTVLAESRLNKTRLVLVIDESHEGATTQRATELLDIIKADAQVSVSATPRSDDYYNTVIVSTKDVINDGMIKSVVAINSDVLFSSDSNGNLTDKAGTRVDVVTALLGTAVTKRKSLMRLYRTHGSKINPLLLIQVPNADTGDMMLKTIMTILEEEYDITFDNGKLALWFSQSNQKVNLENIERNDGVQECLIFKTAIATGWDCPRAHILVKFRLIKSESFSRQIVGRILRMPEQKHYRDSRLNTAYIYTNEESFKFDNENDTASFKDEIEVRDCTLTAVTNINVMLPTMKFQKDVAPKLNTIYMMKEVLTNVASNWQTMVQQSDLLQDSLISITGGVQVGTEQIETDDKIFSEEEMIQLAHDETQLEIQLKRILAKVIQSRGYLNEVFGYLKEFRGSVMPVKRGRRRKNFFADYYKILINNESMLVNFINNSLADSKSWRYVNVSGNEISTFAIPFSDTINIPNSRPTFDTFNKCYFERCPKTGLTTFDSYLWGVDGDTTVDIWYPNWALPDNANKLRYAGCTNGVWGYVTPELVIKRGNRYSVTFIVHDDIKKQVVDDALRTISDAQINVPHVSFEVVDLRNVGQLGQVAPVQQQSADAQLNNLFGQLGLGVQPSQQAPTGGHVSMFGSIGGGGGVVAGDAAAASAQRDELDSMLKGLMGGSTAFKI